MRKIIDNLLLIFTKFNFNLLHSVSSFFIQFHLSALFGIDNIDVLSANQQLKFLHVHCVQY